MTMTRVKCIEYKFQVASLKDELVVNKLSEAEDTIEARLDEIGVLFESEFLPTTEEARFTCNFFHQRKKLVSL